MAICKRNNCNLSIGDLPDERKLRLCPKHYQGKLSNAAKRAQRLGLTCRTRPVVLAYLVPAISDIAVLSIVTKTEDL